MRRSLTVFAALACASCSPAPRPTDADAAAEASVEDSGIASDAETPDVAAADASTCPVDPTPMPFVRSAAAAHAMDEALRMNHLQAKATHNSYHLRPRNVDLPDWNYEHAPLPTQLSMLGVRGLELDLNYNARCNRFEVFHVAAIDDRTTCRQFTECLLHIRNFSQQNPGHHPLFIHIEPKGSEGNYSAQGFAEIEREILTVFDRSWIITPDEVRGASGSLSEAVTTRGWPTLAQARGRVLFYLDNTTAPRMVYTNGGRDLANRLMFVDSRLGDPFAAVMVLNDPIAQAAEIASALRAGYIVRTRADSNPTVAMTNDRAQLAAALASGAQIVSTDFPARIPGSDYFVEIPTGTPSRCSSATAPMACTPALIEDPSKLSAR